MTATGALRFNGSRNDQPDKNRLNWAIVPVLTMFHIGAVVALFFFSWSGLFVAIFLFWVTGLDSAYVFTGCSPIARSRHPSGLSTFSRFAEWRRWKAALCCG